MPWAYDVSTCLKENFDLSVDEELRALKDASFSANRPAKNETDSVESVSLKIFVK